MREIKFRAYIKDLKKVIDVREIDFVYKYITFRLKDKAKDEKRTFDQIKLMQFTGLYDKNGKEIYEGDIVEWAGYTMKILWGEDCGVGYGFIWEPCGSNIDYVESMTGFIDEYEVIGNIFDNPELLGEQQ